VRQKHDVCCELTADEVRHLRDLVRRAYIEGFSEGMREHTSRRGGKTWQESSTAAVLANLEKRHSG
jgi:hypothetical protein